MARENLTLYLIVEANFLYIYNYNNEIRHLELELLKSRADDERSSIDSDNGVQTTCLTASLIMSVTSHTLKGHKGPVLCLDHSSSIATNTSAPPTSAACLLSGSEDGTARLWDLREALRASLCIKAPGEVSSVTFGPKWPGDVVAEGSLFARNFSVFVAVGTQVLGYDLRKASAPILTIPSSTIDMNAQDEINQVVVSHAVRSSSSSRQHLAAADDAGTVRVTDAFMDETTTTPRHRILKHGDGVYVTSAVFRPHLGGGTQLASAGTDCSVKLWDLSKPKKPLDINTIGVLDTNANQVCNPPYIHQLAWSPSGRLLAGALGDGSAAIWSVQNNHRSLVLVSRLEDAHSGSMATVLFPEWGRHQSRNSKLTAYDRLFCTSGNDCSIVLWDLGASLCGDGAIDPCTILPVEDRDLLTQSMDTMTLSDLEQPKTLFAWTHHAKPNWIVSSRGADPVFPSSLFVADTTNDITVYTVPLEE